MTNAGFLPHRIVGGESIWISAENTTQTATDITFTDYTPADGYTLSYQFAAPTPVTVVAVANSGDTGWTLDVTGAQTLSWVPAAITFAGIVTHTATGRTFAVDGGVVYVDSSPLRVSPWVEVLASVDAAIATYAANPNGSFTVDGMSVTYRSLKQLTDLRDYVNYRMQQDSADRPRRVIKSRFQVC